MSRFEIRLVTAPGLEAILADEVREAGFGTAQISEGGVEITGGWEDVWRANLVLRGAVRVLVRIGGFRALHLAQLDKRARRFEWGDVLRADVPVKVEATCRSSRIYHAGAARQRVERALSESFGVEVRPDADLRLLVRIEDDLCTFSLDTSGAPLHQRGYKQAVGKAPLRETMAALFLRQAGFDGRMPVVDPMCGSGTFPIEAAMWGLGLWPGRARRFAFEDLASFDPERWAKIRAAPSGVPQSISVYGSDRDAGAVKGAGENAQRAGVAHVARFSQGAVSELAVPDGGPGLLICNPPYGGRIGNKNMLFGLYGRLGEVARERFAGWRVGVVTSEPGLAKAVGLGLAPAGPPVSHGGLKVRLYLGRASSGGGGRRFDLREPPAGIFDGNEMGQVGAWLGAFCAFLLL